MSEPEAVRHVALKNLLGLHLRPARGLMELAQTFACEVRVTCGEDEVNGKSVTGLVLLAAECGQSLTIRCAGTDAEQAAGALADYVERMPETFQEERVEPA